MTFLFQLALAALVLFSFVMVVGVPVAYASPQNWEQSKSLIYVGVWSLDCISCGSGSIKLFRNLNILAL